MLYLLEPIVARIGRISSSEDLGKYTPLIADFFKNNYSNPEDLRKLRAETNSEGARKNVAKAIGLYIRREVKDKDFWPKMEQNEFVQDIIDMERRIASFISTHLSKLTTGWEVQRVPQVIYQSTKRKMQQDGTRFDENFDLGDELQIITQKNNWDEVFQKIFMRKDGFKNQNELELGFNYLSQIRNPASHGKSVISSKEDLSQCEIYLQKFSRIVPEIIPEYLDANE